MTVVILSICFLVTACSVQFIDLMKCFQFDNFNLVADLTVIGMFSKAKAGFYGVP